MCALIFSTTLSDAFLILRRIQWDIIINVKRFHIKYPLFFSDFNENCIFLTDFRKICYKLLDNPSGGSRIVPLVNKDKRTEEANSRFL